MGRITQRTTHGNDLAFVMKGMGQYMMKDERRSADGDVPIGEMKFRIGVELLIRQVRQVRVGSPNNFLLESLASAMVGKSSGFWSTYRNPWSVWIQNPSQLKT